ncbi:hypothetical protein BH23CHL8_BH23CHL8_11710 [soil metagenome]
MLAAAMVTAGNGLVTTAHAQDTSADPGVSAAPAADRFRLPATADLPADGARTVVDTPDAPADEIDLGPVIASASETVAALAPEDWDLGALAATLPDADAAFALVCDRIGFDAYRGLLRGAQGTLGARAGNAFDRSVLLKALLDAQHVNARFAFGTLDDDAASALVTRTFEAPTVPLASAPGSPLDEAFEAAIGDRARRDHALLASALGDRLAGLSADATQAARADVSHHAWVQIELTDGSWLDLDPSLPDARPGDTLTTAETTSTEIPEAEVHAIGLRVIAEYLQGGALLETPALDETLPAWAAADQRLILTFTPPASGGDGGLLNPGGLFGGGGPAAWAPTLLIDYDAWEGDPIIFSGEMGGGGLMGPGEEADIASLSLEIVIREPGRDPQAIRHVIADRLTVEQRASGAVTPDVLRPIADDDGTPAIFRAILHPMVSTGGSDPRAYAIDRGFAAAMAEWGANRSDLSDISLNELVIPAVIADQSMVVASEQRSIPAIDDDQVRTYVAAPRVYLVTRAIGADDGARQIVETDLARDAIRTLPRDDATADAAARHQLWYGALAGAIESEYVLANAAGLDPEGRVIEGVSFEMGQPLTVLTTPDEGLPVRADASLVAIMAAGGLAVVPGEVAAADTWWEVSEDGTTRSVLAPSLGGSRVGGPRSRPSRVLPPSPPDKPGDQRKQKGQEGKGNEYGTLVTEVSQKVTKTSEVMSNYHKDLFVTVAKPLVKI